MRSLKSLLKKVVKRGIFCALYVFLKLQDATFLSIGSYIRRLLNFIFWSLKDRAYYLMPIILAYQSASHRANLFIPTVRFSSSQKYKLMFLYISNGLLRLSQNIAIELLGQLSDPFLAKQSLAIYRYAGINAFMLGQNKEALFYWGMSGKIKKNYIQATTPTHYRILGSSWFAAVGHIIQLEFYFKYLLLYKQNHLRIIAILPLNDPIWKRMGCAINILRKFQAKGLTILHEGEIEQDYDVWAMENNCLRWQELSEEDKKSMVDEFWEYELEEGNFTGYTHFCYWVQKKWDEKKYPPLFSITSSERIGLQRYLQDLGIPQKAWYVCLHVREGGFHKEWNRQLPSMRDSSIEDYYSAIKEITRAGGWVIRIGDASMKPLVSMPQVIDYAHHPRKIATFDLLFLATSLFFLGTNSGIANITHLYGIPCAYTNWVPIGWPMWSEQDLMICKLFIEKRSGCFLSLKEIFAQNLAFLQNVEDLPKEIEIVCNSPEDIRQLTLDMLSSLHFKNKSFEDIAAPEAVQKSYSKIASQHGTYTYTKLAGFFVEKYSAVFQ